MATEVLAEGSAARADFASPRAVRTNTGVGSPAVPSLEPDDQAMQPDAAPSVAADLQTPAPTVPADAGPVEPAAPLQDEPMSTDAEPAPQPLPEADGQALSSSRPDAEQATMAQEDAVSAKSGEPVPTEGDVAGAPALQAEDSLEQPPLPPEPSEAAPSKEVIVNTIEQLDLDISNAEQQLAEMTAECQVSRMVCDHASNAGASSDTLLSHLLAFRLFAEA